MADRRKVDLARAGAWLQARWERFNAQHLTKGAFFGGIITLFAFFIVTLYPIVRSEKLDWTSWSGGWLKALKLGWFPLLMALYLKYSDSLKRSRVWDKVQRRSRTSRQILTGKALRDLCVCLQNGRDPSKLQDIRERILQSAALGVEELLGMGGGHRRIVASLLEFVDADKKEMRVVARSTKERSTGVTYPCPSLVGWMAIEEGRIRVIDDVTADPRLEHVGEKKPYRTVAAIPIGFGGQACAALSLDHELPYAFFAKSNDIAIQLEPYAATLALTYGQESVYHASTYEPPSRPS